MYIYNLECIFQIMFFFIFQAVCLETPIQQLSDEELSHLYFYNSRVHRACFVLPEFVRKVIES